MRYPCFNYGTFPAHINSKNRPYPLQHRIDTVVIGEDNGTAHYIFHGSFPSPYVFLLAGVPIKWDFIFKKTPIRPHSLFEIGTGCGHTLDFYRRSYGLEVSGITLHDYRGEKGKYQTLKVQSTTNDSPVISYEAETLYSSNHIQVGNAENLDHQNQHGYILSQKTFCHFFDPLGSLCRAYDALQDNGILLVDFLNIPGCTFYWNNIVHYMQNNGYRIFSNRSILQNYVPTLIIIKTDRKPRLEFPVFYQEEYDRNKEQVSRYKVDTDLIKPDAEIFEHDFINGVNLVLQKAMELKKKDANFNLLMSYCHNLQDLFNEHHIKTFHKLPSVEQYFAVFTLIAKSITFKEFQKYLGNLKEKNQQNFFDRKNPLYNPRNNFQHLNGLLMADQKKCPINIDFKTDDALIYVASCLDIMGYGQFERAQNYLKRIGVINDHYDLPAPHPKSSIAMPNQYKINFSSNPGIIFAPNPSN